MKKKTSFGDPQDDEYQEQPKWYNQINKDPTKFDRVTDQVLIELKDEAKKILDSEIANYNIKSSKSNADYRWMKTVMTKGTVSDKIAAYTVIIQDNPVYNLETIRNVIGMVKVGKKNECIAVIETFTELFLSDLLRPNEKLKSFYDRPLSHLNDISSGNAITRRKYLSYWYFEDQLREAYHTFIQALNTAAHDTVDSNKEKAIAAMSKLLAGSPEQEKNLLTHIINKLGDPSQKVASKTMYCLTQVLKQHSNMQGVVLQEIEKLLFRPNIGRKAQYYSLCFISQFYLCAENPEVARKLIEVYFSFFKKCIKEGEVDSRMLSALLIGVNRAYPYANLQMDTISEHIDTMYRIVHVANFNVSLNALTLLFQVSQCSDNVNDRFYSALYRKLFDSKLLTCTNQAIILNLVYKSLLRDTKTERVIAFMKRLLQVALTVQPNFACGILFLVSQIDAKKKENLIHLEPTTALKMETNCSDDEDEEEKYVDAIENGEETVKENEEQTKEEEDDLDLESEEKFDTKAVPGWNHITNSSTSTKDNKKMIKHEKDKKPIYDPNARNPLYAKVETSAYYELSELRNHFHPSVRLFTENILDGKKIVYSGDPLKDFTLIRFLERFVFKNPKKVETLPESTFAKRKNYQPQGARSISVFSNEYLAQNEKSIPVDELFLYTYMQKRYKEYKIKEKDEDDDDSDLESVASEEFEDMLNKMSGLKDDDDDDIDYMNEIGENMKKQKDKKKKKKGAESDEDESDDDDVESENEESDDQEDEDIDDENHISDDDEGDIEMNDDDRDLLGDLSDDADDEALFFDSDNDGEEGEAEEQPKHSKLKNKKIKGKKSSGGSIFAAAEEFASLLEDEGDSHVASGSSNQFANMDKAAVKQLDWEDKRNQWIQGYNHAVGNKKFGSKGKKRPPTNLSKQNSNKKKKFKK